VALCRALWCRTAADDCFGRPQARLLIGAAQQHAYENL
jgi:hypothetical protein